MKTIYHAADSRGVANHSWLNSHHTFSFGGYYDPERTNFGVLRVINDDTVAGGRASVRIHIVIWRSSPFRLKAIWCTVTAWVMAV